MRATERRQTSSVSPRAAILDDVAAIARVHVDCWRTTYRGIISDAYLAQMSYDTQQARWKARLADAASFTYVAEDAAGHIVGYASGGPERTGDTEFKGELYAICVLQSHQRQGLGLRLVEAVVARLLQTGFRSMLVWVLADNPYRRFYEHLGGQPARKNEIEIGGVMYEEVGYGWTDIARLGRLGSPPARQSPDVV